MEATPDEVYWIGIRQIWEPGAPADGEVHAVTGREYGDDDFARLVRGMISVAVPLLEVTDGSILEERLLRSILAANLPT